MKIRTRLFIGFGIVVLAMLFVVSFSFYTSKTIYHTFQELRDVIIFTATAKSDVSELAATEQVIQEVYARGFQYGLLACVLVVLLTFVIVLIETQSIVAPLKALQKGVKKIGLGDLDYKVSTDVKDEVGELSQAFDQMTFELKKTTMSTDMQNTAQQKLRATEQQLEAISQRLHDETAERKQFEEALEVSNGEYRDFIYVVSHDLREPLRKISSFGMLLKDSLGEKLEKENQENLSFMIDGAERMTQMIDDLLAYSRINTKAAMYEIVDLNQIIEELEQLELISLMEEAGATIEIPQSLPKVYADPALIRQLLQNLIINGIMHRRRDVQPRILIRAEKTAENKVRIELQDNGAGIDENHQKDLFKILIRFNAQEENERTGTELAVCKNIVDKHGGQIGFDSKTGCGSAFWFTLPESKSVEQKQNNPVSYVRI